MTELVKELISFAKCLDANHMRSRGTLVRKTADTIASLTAERDGLRELVGAVKLLLCDITEASIRTKAGIESVLIARQAVNESEAK